MMDSSAPAKIEALIRDVTNLAARSEIEREVIEAAMRSVLSAMERVAPNARGELQRLMDAFIADPDDADVTARIGALLRDARLPEH